MSEFILRMEGISKSFPGVKALDDIHLEIKKGEIHALIGENGAGKSTLIKILAGIYQPDSGTIYIDDEPVNMENVSVARKYGISVIHQELNLAKNMTIAENIFLGRFPAKKNGFVDDKKMIEEANRLLPLIGLENVSPDTPVSKLSIAQQQMVEICRSLSEDIKLLVMDEPTASLAAAEVDNLLKIMRKIKEQGVTIIFISHKLNEIYEVCDRITVLRDGRYIGTDYTANITYNRLINMMVGRDIKDVFPPHISSSTGEKILEVNNVSSDKVTDISFYLNKKEILGFYGLVGSGRSEVIRAMLGIDKCKSKDIVLNGERIAIRTPADAVKHGIVLAPEDRKYEGLILKQTVDFNITITILKQLIKGIKLDRRRNDEIVSSMVERLRVKTPSFETKIRNLSGGNQQKVVLAKWLVTNPKVLILDEPTRGIDVGAKQEIYRLIYEVANMGVSIILISSEMPEVINLCDRVYVLRDGKISGMVHRSDLTEQSIIKLAIGGM